jgi:hypothetical protein
MFVFLPPRLKSSSIRRTDHGAGVDAAAKKRAARLLRE